MDEGAFAAICDGGFVGVVEFCTRCCESVDEVSGELYWVWIVNAWFVCIYVRCEIRSTFIY